MAPQQFADIFEGGLNLLIGLCMLAGVAIPPFRRRIARILRQRLPRWERVFFGVLLIGGVAKIAHASYQLSGAPRARASAAAVSELFADQTTFSTTDNGCSVRLPTQAVVADSDELARASVDGVLAGTVRIITLDPGPELSFRFREVKVDDGWLKPQAEWAASDKDTLRQSPLLATGPEQIPPADVLGFTDSVENPTFALFDTRYTAGNGFLVLRRQVVLTDRLLVLMAVLKDSSPELLAKGQEFLQSLRCTTPQLPERPWIL